MEASYFEYLEKKFRPIGFVNHDSLTRAIPFCNPIGISGYGKGKWSYRDFYHETPPPKKGKMALYEMEGKIVLPLLTELVEYSGPYDPWLPTERYKFQISVSVWSTSTEEAKDNIRFFMCRMDEDIFDGWHFITRST